MRSEIFTICDYAADNNGKLTIVGTFTRYIVNALPAQIISFAVVARLRYEKGEEMTPLFNIVIKNNEGKAILDAPIKANLLTTDIPDRVCNVVINVAGMPLEQLGRYDVLLTTDNASFTTSFYVLKRDEQ